MGGSKISVAHFREVTGLKVADGMRDVGYLSADDRVFVPRKGNGKGKRIDIDTAVALYEAALPRWRRQQAHNAHATRCEEALKPRESAYQAAKNAVDALGYKVADNASPETIRAYAEAARKAIHKVRDRDDHESLREYYNAIVDDYQREAKLPRL